MFWKRKTNLNTKLFKQLSITLLGFVIIILISISLVENTSKQIKINKEIDELKEKLVQLDQKNNDLKSVIEYLESDQYVLEQARLNLNYKQEGEKVAIIKEKGDSSNDDKTDTKTNNSDQSENVLVNNSHRWLKYFFN